MVSTFSPESDRAAARDASRCSAWLAAYALGLAHTERCGDECVRELLAAADGRPDLLSGAARHLETFVDADEKLRARAVALLAESLGATSDGVLQRSP